MLRSATWASAVILGIGLVMLFGYAWIGEWPYYPMVTPLVLAVGLLALVWCWRRAGGRPTAVVLALVAVAVCVFWATATLAQWTGLGAAQRTARNLDQLPAVVMDTRERLYLGTTPDSGVTESDVGGPAVADEDQAFRYPLSRATAPHPVRRPNVPGSRALDAQQLHPSGADRQRPGAVPVRQRPTGVRSGDHDRTRSVHGAQSRVPRSRPTWSLVASPTSPLGTWDRAIPLFEETLGSRGRILSRGDHGAEVLDLVVVA